MVDRDAAQFGEREAFTAAIVESDEERKVIVSGPGTGKTTTFRRVSKERSGPVLVLSFLRRLVEDLREDLEGLADVYTFHGYAYLQLRANSVPGIGRGFTFYPPLFELVSSDLAWLSGVDVAPQGIALAFNTLNERAPEVAQALASGNYYDAVTYSDSVYRLLRHYREDLTRVPAVDQLIVDEYQDFCRMEVELINLLSRSSPVLIVGDDDQALYWRRGASPEFIREVARNGDFRSFELPFCSRCPEVVVNATNAVLGEALSLGLLEDRVEKRFESFLPAKRKVSEAFPKIRHVYCTVQSRQANYMARYITGRIAEIPQADILESYEARQPTALVIGPPHVAEQVHEGLERELGRVELKMGDTEEVQILDGYRLLDSYADSRLGWRIVTYLDPPGDMKSILHKTLRLGGEWIDVLPAEYIEKHSLNRATIVSLKRGNEVATDDAESLAALGIDSSQFLSPVEQERTGAEDADLTVEAEEGTGRSHSPQG
ncbi:MAG: UvrD-helicase domain-containing protein [Actinomycetota bacterium]